MWLLRVFHIKMKILSKSISLEQVLLVVPLVCLLLLYTPCQARPRRRFCESYPFAPRCLGVAAKRSASRSDLYEILLHKAISKTLQDKMASREGLGTHKSEPYSADLHKIVSLILNSDKKDILTDSGESWDDAFDD